MNAKRLRRLKRQLYSPLPLIGGWVQRRAAASLARDGSPNAIQALAESLGRHPDERVKSIVRRVVLSVRTQASINAVCRAWAETRHPWLGERIQAQKWVATSPPQVVVLSALHTGESPSHILDGGAEIAAALIQACDDREANIAQSARTCLGQLRSPAAVDRLCQVWAETRSALLEEALLKGNYVAQRPSEVRVLSALKVGAQNVVERGGRRVVVTLLQAAEDPDGQIAAQARLALRSMRRTDAQEVICRLVIEENHPIAREAALAAGYAPRESYQRALFFFLTEQWHAYQALDFDRRLLRAAYQAAGGDLRQRILGTIRSSGRAELLPAVSGRGVVVQTAEEAGLLVELLSEQSDWGTLWSKVFELPLGASRKALKLLGQGNWQPEREDERAILAELTHLATLDMVTSAEEMRQLLPTAILRARAKLRNGRINDLAFCPEGALIAVGTTRRKVVLWDLQRGQRQAVLGAFEHSIGEVSYSYAGHLLFAERTKAHEPCTTYLHHAGETIRLHAQAGSVTALEPVDGASALITGRDQSVTLLDLNAPGRVINQRKLGFWARTARVGSGKAALFHSGVSLLTLPELREITSTYQTFVSRSAAFAPQNQDLIIGNQSGQVLVLHIEQQYAELRPLTQHPGRVQGIETLEKPGIVISAGSHGTVHFTGWAMRRLVGKIEAPMERLTSLHVSPDGSFMALGASDASLSLWDLRVLETPTLFTLPFANSTPNHLAALRMLIEHRELPPRALNALAFIERVLRFRFRFDVEISETPQIRTGEYDIEIE